VDDHWGLYDDDGYSGGTTEDVAADFEQAPEEYYVLPQASGWAILETVEGGLHERGGGCTS
jgi:hypothetical protein